MADMVGKTIGNYKIEALLGTGGMGQVYRGVHTFLKVERAVKVMNPGVASDTSFQARFQQEAQAAAALSHQNIVEVFDFGEQNDQFYMVMELVVDGSLRSLLKQRSSGQTWELPLGLDLIRQAAEGLGYAHDKGMVHRDIKPDNLLLQKLSDSPSGKTQYLLKITDFGLARLAEGGGVRTVSGMVMGTPAYMSPEQCQGGAVDGRSDLYSLGVVLYEVATGYLPFQANSVSDAIYKHVFVAPPPPRQVVPDLPQALEDIILRCLAKKPEGRFATGQELARALQGVMGVPELTTMAPIRPDRPKASPTPATPPAAATALEAPNAGGTPPPAVAPLAGYSAYPRIRVMDEGGRTLQVVEVTQATMIVGRQPGSDLLLAEEGVSRQHLRITKDGDRLSVTDLGSNNGTLLAGSRLLPQATTVWEKGQAVRIGPYWLLLEAPTAPAAAAGSSQQLSGAPRAFNSAPTVAGATGGPAGPAAPVAPPTRESGRIRVSLEQETLTLTPGQPTTIKVTLANTGTTVDHLTLVVEGVPKSWIQSSAQGVQLNPGQQETTTLTVQAPRMTNSRAGMYPVTLRALSRENPGDSGSASARWTAAPFTADTLSLRPERVTARRTARFNMMLQNSGNAPVQYSFSGEDPEEKLQYQFSRATVAVNPGATLPVPLTVRAPWKFSGPPERMDFRVTARPSHGGSPQVVAGQLSHVSLLPGWLPPPVLALLVAGALLLVSLFATGVLPGALANIGASPTATSSTTGNGTGGNGGGATATTGPTPTVQPTPTQPIQSTSESTLAQNTCFDLDDGTTVAFGSSQADVCWQVTDPTRTLTVQNGARMSLQSAGTAPGYFDCLNASLRTDPIDGSPGSNEIPSGTYLCFKTSDGRTAMMHIRMYGSDLDIDYTTWKP